MQRTHGPLTVVGAILLTVVAAGALRAQTQPERAALPTPTVAPPASHPAPAPPPAETTAPALAPAPLSETDRPLPINLATALRLSDARPLVVAAAQASAIVAEAKYRRARVLWVPTLNTGINYYRHDGGNQDILNGNLIQNSTNFFMAGSGAQLIVATTDAIFEPLAARQVLRSRQLDIQTAKNDALLATAQAYFTVHQQRGTYAGALDAVARARDLVQRIDDLGRDLVPRVEVDRARTLQAQLEQEVATARERWRVASADLTRVLRLDPAATVVPVEPDDLTITLIDPQSPVDSLIPIGLTNRPELASQQALVQAALVRLRQERLRPLTPSILITGFQTPEFFFNGTIFGTGSGSSLNQWAGRADVNLQLIWELQNLGFGNAARIRERRGDQAQALVELFHVQDRVAAEVAQSQARLEAAAVRVEAARTGLKEALITFDGNLEGLRETTRFGDLLVLVYRPQEVVIALTRLKQAYDHYFGTVGDYNRAQFALYHALGFAAQGLALTNPPGAILPVNTERPAYMPPVVGPPVSGEPLPVPPEPHAAVTAPPPPPAPPPAVPSRRRFGLFHRR